MTDKKEEPKTISVKIKWEQCEVDPKQYKPWKPLLFPQNIFVVVEVPESMIVSHTQKEVRLTEKGMAFVMGRLSIAMQKAYDSLDKKQQKSIENEWEDDEEVEGEWGDVD